VALMAIVKIINSPRSQNLKGLHGVLAYCCRDAKTTHEGRKLITGINCVPQIALQEFMNTKRLHGQTGGRMYYHMVQSFPPEETITPETAHEIAVKLAASIPGFEIVVATHRDAHHVHSHFVINSVSFETGKKYHSDPQSLQALWDASDKLCLQYGLSVIQRKSEREHRMNDREYRAYDRGDSWKMALELAIDDCMTLARSRAHFLRLMEFRGYEVTWSDTRKNITYTTPQGYKCRDRKLNGRKYLKEEMEYEFEQRAALCRRYENGTETNHRPGRGGAEDRGCHGAKLERHDLIPEAASRNPGTDPGASGSVGNRRTADHTDAGADRFSVGASGSRRGCDAEVSGQGGESNNGGGDLDENSGQGNGEALWAAEREIFLRALRAEGKTGQVDAPVSADQPDPQRAAGHPAVDAAYLTAHLLDLFDDDDEIEDCTTRYYGPTLHM
jgi:hypothetical protein